VRVSYTTKLIERDEDDKNGQGLCDSLATHLTYWSTNGLDTFSLTPVVNSGHTVGVIVGARGENPSMFGASRAFMSLTGLQDANDIGEFLDVEPDKVQSHIDKTSRQENVAQSLKGDKSMGYVTDLLEREPDDTSGRELCSLVAVYLDCMSSNGLDRFLLLPVQNNGSTASIIAAARGKRPTATDTSS